jgi:hypothetical protein
MLELCLVPQIQDAGLLVTTVLQQGGTSPHWAQEVHKFLNATSGNNWYGWGGPIPLSKLQMTSYGAMLKQCSWPMTPTHSLNFTNSLHPLASITPDILGNTWWELQILPSSQW